MRLLVLFTVLLLHIDLFSAEEIDISKPLRIHQLMPREGMFVSLAIEPALPLDFIALSQDEEINYSDWVYWGPKKVIRAYLKNPLSLNEPIIRVSFAQNITLKSDGTLDIGLIEQSFIEAEVKDLKISYGKWGDLPYCILSGVVKNEKFHMAYVGGNELEGTFFLFHLLVPNNLKEEPRALELWNRFFKETKYLPESLAIKAHGQEMHPGYTIQDVAGCKMKVIAERKKSNQKTRFACIPVDSRVKFIFDGALSTHMGFDWHRGAPLLKIRGTYIVDDGWVNYSTTTSIFIKEVDDFTPVPLLRANVFLKTL